MRTSDDIGLQIKQDTCNSSAALTSTSDGLKVSKTSPSSSLPTPAAAAGAVARARLSKGAVARGGEEHDPGGRGGRNRAPCVKHELVLAVDKKHVTAMTAHNVFITTSTEREGEQRELRDIDM